MPHALLSAPSDSFYRLTVRCLQIAPPTPASAQGHSGEPLAYQPHPSHSPVQLLAGQRSQRRARGDPSPIERQTDRPDYLAPGRRARHRVPDDHAPPGERNGVAATSGGHPGAPGPAAAQDQRTAGAHAGPDTPPSPARYQALPSVYLHQPWRPVTPPAAP